MDSERGVTSVRLQPDVESPLEQLTKRLNRSKSYIINEALRQFIAQQTQEEQRWQETLQAIESVKTGQQIDADQVHNWLESWGSEDELDPPTA